MGIEHNWVLCLAVLLYGLLILGAPLWILATNCLLLPLEKAIQRSYLWSAASRLHHACPIVVGITGSYGKTSTKDILAHLLSGQRHVLSTPKSYNTLMGICKVINTSLQPNHQVFVVEMGAYESGEIAQICNLVHPRLGAITAIGPQHLERFRSMDDIARAKYELIEALPPSGVAVFDAEDAYTAQFRQQTHDKKIVLVSTEENPLADLYATKITTTSGGLTFTIVERSSGRCYPCAVNLLGRHNILNILIATALALELGMSLRVVSERLKSLSPVQHRLQLLKRADGLNVIDDAYNSNPVGAQNALEALGDFEGGRKVLVTPGLVELGPLGEKANYELGQQAASVCDLVILVGHDRTLPIRDGLRSAGFDLAKIEVVATMRRASEILAKLARANDTILFLNDLPDTYS
jgi:UDP-N-acetylmuramoyl-tripeptide--D-alanyl-D-alanine ligase